MYLKRRLVKKYSEDQSALNEIIERARSPTKGAKGKEAGDEEIEEDPLSPAQGKLGAVLKSRDEEIKAQKRKAKKGGIRFAEAVVVAGPEAPKDLICEECEKAFSSHFCSLCDQVFCSKCLGLCHQRANLGRELHEHEVEDAIRVIQIGDTSRIKPFTGFVMPDNELFEEDFMKIRDLEQPNSLSADKGVVIKPSTTPTQYPKYKVNELVLFLDPVTQQEAYGRIISEWDFRHGLSAPVISRGEQPGAYYIVEMTELLGDKPIQELIEIATPKPPPDYPMLEGIEDDPHRQVAYKTSYIERKLKQSQILREFGPKYHFRTGQGHKQIINKELDDDDDLNSVEGGTHGSSVSVLSGGGGGGGGGGLGGSVDLGTGDVSRPGSVEGRGGGGGMPLFPVAEEGLGDASVASSSAFTAMSPMVLHVPPSSSPVSSAARGQRVITDGQGAETWFQGGGENTQDLLLREEKVRLEDGFSVDDSVPRIHGEVDNLGVMRYFHPTLLENVTLSSANQYVEHVIDINASQVPRHAFNRRTYHAQGSLTTVEGPAAYKILVFPESAVCRPSDRSALLSNQRFEFLRTFIDKQFVTIFKELVRFGFNVWRDNMEHLREVQHHLNARKIQATVRRWLCRNVLDDLRNEILDKEYQKWLKLHKKFHFVPKETPNCVTYDHQKYFATSRDANKYAEISRRCVSKIVKHLNSERLKMLREACRRWRSVITEFNEKNLKISHIEQWADGVFAANEQLTVEDEQMEAWLAHRKLSVLGVQGVGTDSLQYDNVASMPMALTRTKPVAPETRSHLRLSPSNDLAILRPTSSESSVVAEEGSGGDRQESSSAAAAVGAIAMAATSDQAQVASTDPTISGDPEADLNEGLFPTNQSLFSADSIIDIDEDFEFPPWNPSQGIDLPVLPRVAVASTASARLALSCSKEDRLQQNEFRAKCEGPTDDTAWIIPGRLAMGCMPTDQNKPRKKSELTRQAAWLLAGLSTFISLMEDEEEKKVEQTIGIDPLEVCLKSAYSEARNACNNLFIECKHVIYEENIIIRRLPALSKSHHEYQNMYQKRVRSLGRIRRAEDGIKRAKAQLATIPRRYDWSRMPLNAHTEPSIHEFLPMLWEIERRLAKGESILLYSKDGHGRVGYVCAALIGRLYALSTYEALYRVQACHDSAKREAKRAVPVNCPQSPTQRNLVTEVLSLSNRVYTGPTWRSHSDPETNTDEHNALVPLSLQVVGRFPAFNPSGPVPRMKQSVFLDHDVARDTTSVVSASAPSLEVNRLHAQEPVDLDTLYDPNVVRQTRSMIRALPTQKFEPADSPDVIPLVRPSFGEMC